MKRYILVDDELGEVELPPELFAEVTLTPQEGATGLVKLWGDHLRGATPEETADEQADFLFSHLQEDDLETTAQLLAAALAHLIQASGEASGLSPQEAIERWCAPRGV